MKKGWTSPEFTIKSSKGDHTTIYGYASVFGVVDSQNDMVTQGAFKSVIGTESVKLLWQHDATKPIGIVTSLEEDEYGLKIEAEINNKVTAGIEAVALIKQGAVCGLSIGCIIKSSSYNVQGVRIIEDIELTEVSVVTFPANAQAEIRQVKGLDITNKYHVTPTTLIDHAESQVELSLLQELSGLIKKINNNFV